MSMASGPTASATGVNLNVALKDEGSAEKAEDAVMAKKASKKLGSATQEEVDTAVEEVGEAQAVVDEILAKLGKNKKPVAATAPQAVQEATGSVAESDDDDAANYVNKVAAAKKEEEAALGDAQPAAVKPGGPAAPVALVAPVALAARG